MYYIYIYMVDRLDGIVVYDTNDGHDGGGGGTHLSFVQLVVVVEGGAYEVHT